MRNIHHFATQVPAKSRFAPAVLLLSILSVAFVPVFSSQMQPEGQPGYILRKTRDNTQLRRDARRRGLTTSSGYTVRTTRKAREDFDENWTGMAARERRLRARVPKIDSGSVVRQIRTSFRIHANTGSVVRRIHESRRALHSRRLQGLKGLTNASGAKRLTEYGRDAAITRVEWRKRIRQRALQNQDL